MSGLTAVRGERGIALVVALLVLVVVTLLSAVLIMTVNVDTQIAGHSQRASQALNYAEAGIAEAISRIQNEDIPSDGGNPRMVAQVFLATPGNVPAVGVDTLAMATAQPVGNWLRYSTPAKGPEVLTVRYRTNEARTQVYRYDPALNPAIQTGSGYPIFVITSTGRQGADERRVTTEVIQQPVNVSMKGALVSEKGVKFTGNAWACGYNHRADTPTDTGINGRTGLGGCNEDAGIHHWETGSGDLSGIWTSNNVNGGGASQVDGNPPKAEGQAGFYAGPWETIGMSQADFFSWIGPSTNSVPGDLDGIYYMDNNNTSGDASGGYTFHGEGSGMLYVDGDATFNAGFVYRGLIYVEGNVKLNGHMWVLGALVVKGQLTNQVQFNGGATILYSEDAVKQNISKQRGQFVTLTWHEDN
jgi:Tfp pilus assembly protein PilX